MDRMLELPKIEPMRKVMLMQEEIFRQQVRELHRLYNLQKALMQEVEKNRLTQRDEARAARTDTSSTFHTFIGSDGLNKLSLPESFHPSRHQSFLKPVIEKNDVEVELTLGIGQKRGSIDEMNKSTRAREIGSCSRRRDNGDEYEGSGLSMSNSSSSTRIVYRENSIRAHWLIRDLSSNGT